MGLFNPEIHIHLNVNMPAVDNSQLVQIKQFMSEQFDQLKAKVEALTPLIDGITQGVQTANTGLAGVTDDLAYLKEKLQSNPTPEEITALAGKVDGLITKITPAADAINTLSTQLTDLDAQTKRPEPEQQP
jgi:methyl-accepting chemotaxis protein